MAVDNLLTSFVFTFGFDDKSFRSYELIFHLIIMTFSGHIRELV